MSTTAITRRQLGAIAAGAGAAIAFGNRAPAWGADTPPGQQTYFLMVFSDPVAGQEDAYKNWFADPHRPSVRALPGVVAVQHFVDAQLELRHSPRKTPQDLLLYTIATDHPAKLNRQLARQAQAGRAWPGPAIASVQTLTYQAFRPEIKGAGGEPPGAKPGAVQTYLIVAFGDAIAGQDSAYNNWYDTVHEPELLSKPGVVSGQRAMLSESQVAPLTAQPRYLMLMNIATTDLPAVFRGILAGGAPSPAMDRTHGFGYTYRAVGPAITGAAASD